jgi:hypothetical protein
LNAQHGHAYLIMRSGDPIPTLVHVTRTAATTVEKLDHRRPLTELR